MDPIAMILAVDRTREHARSALPDAPLVPRETHVARARRRDDVRTATARWLHRIAERVEPPRQQECVPGT